jgi:hypothetical protein
MKRILLIGLLAACGKPNDIDTLHHEASELSAYFQPRLDAADKRMKAIFDRGKTIPANLPGIEEVGKRLTEARDTVVQLRGIVGKGPDGKSAVEKQADLAAKDRKVDDLEKLVEDTELTLERGLRVVHDDLNAVESWIAQYDQEPNRKAAPAAPAAPAEGNTTTPPTQNQTGQPPAAAQPTQPAGGH